MMAEGDVDDTSALMASPKRPAPLESEAARSKASATFVTGPVPTRTFSALLCVYVAPLTWALLREGVYSSERRDLPPCAASRRPARAFARSPRPTTNRAGRRRYLSPFTTVPALVAWLALCLALYWAQRLVADLGRWKMNEKTAAVHKEDLLRQTLLSGLLFLAGRVGARLVDEPLLFGVLLVCFTFGFGVLFELVRHCNIELTADCWKNAYTVALMVFTAAIVGALVANHLALVNARNAQRDPATPAFSATQAVGLAAFVIGAHVALTLAPGKTSAHFHHWYTGFVGSCFCVFESDVSLIAHCMLLGIYLHGAALFGVEACFYPADDDIPR